MKETELAPAELEEFMQRVYQGKAKAYYMGTAAVDRHLEEREEKLLSSAEPQIESSTSPTRRKPPARRKKDR